MIADHLDQQRRVISKLAFARFAGPRKVDRYSLATYIFILKDDLFCTFSHLIKYGIYSGTPRARSILTINIPAPLLHPPR